MATFSSSAGLGKVFLDNVSNTPVDFTDYLKQAAPDTTIGTADATVLSDTATKFVFTIEDGGEFTVDINLDAGNVVWPHLVALWNAKYIGTWTHAPLGTATGKPKITREVGITKLGTPVSNDDIAKVSVTFKTQGATVPSVY